MRFSGVADYMAMEKLLELHLAPDADLIVLDTPPASEAIDFLDAPRRLLDLLNSRAITLLGRSGGGLLRGLKMVDFAARTVLQRLRSRDRTPSARRCAGIRRELRGHVCGLCRARAKGRRAAAIIRNHHRDRYDRGSGADRPGARICGLALDARGLQVRCGSGESHDAGDSRCRGNRARENLALA